MAYLGNSPARSFISFERQVFTIVNSQTVYTLDHSVTNENDIRLVVNNVVQEPGSGKAYTASGTTLTLSAALVNGTDEMYCVYLGRATATEAPGAGSVGTSQLASDAVTEAKIADGAVESEHLNNNVISGQTALGATPADTDELLVSDAGTIKRVDYSYLKVANTPIVNAMRTGSTQSISATTHTRIVFNNERLDTGSIYDSSTGVATIAEAGKYLVMATIGVRNLTGSSDYFGAAIQNTDRSQSGFDSAAGYVSGASGYGWKNIHLSQIKNYSASDTIAIYCYGTEAVDLPDESQNLVICKIIE